MFSEDDESGFSGEEEDDDEEMDDEESAPDWDTMEEDARNGTFNIFLKYTCKFINNHILDDIKKKKKRLERGEDFSDDEDRPAVKRRKKF